MKITVNGVDFDVSIKKEQGDMLYSDVVDSANDKVAEGLWNFKNFANGPAMIRWTKTALQSGISKKMYNGKDRSNVFQIYVSNVMRKHKGLNPLPVPEKQKETKPESVMASALNTVNFGYEESGATEEVVPATPVVATKPSVKIFTDGACKGNPGPGGWGVILRMGSHEKEISGGEELTTNNRMELRAGVEALKALKKPCNVILTSDSKYLVKGATEWLSGWSKNGWKNSKGDPVVNKDLWEELVPLLKAHNVQFNWVKGHNGHPENERCDALACSEAAKFNNVKENVEEDVPSFLQDDDAEYYDYVDPADEE